MRRALLLVLATLPLAAFDCGGEDPAPSSPFDCTVTVAGEVSEQLWCIVAVFDYTAMPVPPEYASDLFVFELAAYRGPMEAMELAGAVAFRLPARASTGVAYGWDSSTAWANVEAGSAIRYENDVDGFPVITHLADGPLGDYDVGTGKLSVTLTRIPPASATNEELLGVDGTLTATLPSETLGGDDVTFTARF